MTLKINRVALKFLSASAEKMVEAHLVQRCRRGVRGNMSADVVLDAVRPHHHGQRVPANQALDAPLKLLVSRKQRLQSYGNAIGIRRVRAKRQVDAVDGGMSAQPLKNLSR